MIEVNHLVKRYGNHKAVDDLSFKVEEGQIYGFLGPNGAGKSTTMNIMTGYIGATSGEVIINGHNISDEPEAAKKCIGYLPEIPPLYMDMTVREYLEFAAELKKIPKDERSRQILEAVRLTKLEDMMPRLIKNLSKGYRQRVGLAQAILGFPPIIILDEPTVGLDPKQIIEIRDLIKALARKHTIILSSHILQEVSAVCDHIMIISHGRLVASDTPENLEKMMNRDNTLEMEVKGTVDEIQNVVHTVCPQAELDNISSEAGIVRFMIKENGGEDIREELFYAFAGRNCPILTMSMKVVSLEKIFLELTDSDENCADETPEHENDEISKDIAEEASDGTLEDIAEEASDGTLEDVPEEASDGALEDRPEEVLDEAPENMTLGRYNDVEQEESDNDGDL